MTPRGYRARQFKLDDFRTKIEKQAFDRVYTAEERRQVPPRRRRLRHVAVQPPMTIGGSYDFLPRPNYNRGLYSPNRTPTVREGILRQATKVTDQWGGAPGPPVVRSSGQPRNENAKTTKYSPACRHRSKSWSR